MSFSSLIAAVFLCTTSILRVYAVTLVDHSGNPFDAYVVKFGRKYAHGSQEYAHRRALFEDRLETVQRHNARSDRLWEAEVGMFADRTDEERAAARGWRRIAASATHGGNVHPNFAAGASLLETSEPPATVDWRFLTTSSQILDQDSCGSCWAATTASVLEAHYELHHGQPRQFSVQEIMSCSPNPDECGGQGGCKGATVELGMQWVLQNGLRDEEDVPYEAKDMECPRPQQSLAEEKDVRGHIKGGQALGLMGWQTLMPKNEEGPLARAVIEQGPVAISVAAGTWHEYGGGIFDGCEKDVIVNHAVTLYGYGKERRHRYWLIRNTWGPDWGENGFLRMKRHGQGETYCGTDVDYQQGVGCKNDPKTVKVCGMCGMYSDSVVPHFAGAKNLSRPGVPSWLLADAMNDVVIGADASARMVRRNDKIAPRGNGVGK